MSSAPQFEHEPAPISEYVPAPQFEQEPAPISEYVPALQVLLWSVDLDAPLLYAGAQFLATAAGIYRAVGVQEARAEQEEIGGEKRKTS